VEFVLPGFVKPKDVARHIGDNIEEWDEIDLAQCQSIIDIVSAQVRFYGTSWTDPILAPQMARAICLEASARGFQNPGGFSVERGDMITLTRSDPFALGSALTETEIAILGSYSQRGGFHSILMVRDVMISDVMPSEDA
jgi:hypothetical protein